ncbi:hypothetical protein [Pleomorphovibrio marinus]|uniref:hypothetical protein n=1 Tax=Pleomorphovibrio marinus TaxID=2164132 RepID=UPI000E0B1A65|nr:hypothetical protein [Pleomorphovibrio marinus]
MTRRIIVEFKPAYIFPLVIIGLLIGIAGGWLRMGYAAFLVPHAAAQHGLLMVGGFLGTLISLERALVIKGKFWFCVPLCSGLSIPAILLGWPELSIYLVGAASIGLVGIMYVQSLRHPVLDQYLLLFGALCWVLGNFMVANTGFMLVGVPWWIGFILFTIVGERLELSKFLPLPPWSRLLLPSLLGVFFLGMWVPFHTWGIWVMGISVCGIAGWLLVFDMARYAAKKAGLFRYIGIGLITGYVWLLIHGLILFLIPEHALHYDLYLHTFFLGFTFSMIWAHAPIILPAVLKIRQQPFHPLLWVGWGVFQVSLLGRIWASLSGNLEGRVMFSLINGWAIIVMFLAMGSLVFLISRSAECNSGNLKKSVAESGSSGIHQKKLAG